ncbi:MAG: magnesium transporter CorA family protein [Patescibacteria group bacterium UBA2163]
MRTIYQRSITYRKPRAVEAFQKGAWIQLTRPTEEELQAAADTLSLDLDTLRDALDPYEVPRFEAEDGAVYIFMRYPQGESTVPLLVVVAKEGVLTIEQEDSVIMKKFREGHIDFYTTQKARFLLLILSEINRNYTVAISSIRRDVNRLKTRPDKMSSKDIVQFVSYESTVSDYLDALIPQQVVLNKILVGKALNIHEADEDVAEDIILSTNQLIEAGRATLRTMINIRSAYNAISTEHLNTIIRRLTALTVLLTIPMVITGFYGMNVALPGSEHPLAAYFILFGTTGIMATLIFTLSKNKWL